eukprot:jgi/Tetstr1/436593/TSEL_025390.t1
MDPPHFLAIQLPKAAIVTGVRLWNTEAWIQLNSSTQRRSGRSYPRHRQNSSTLRSAGASRDEQRVPPLGHPARVLCGRAA